MTGRHVYFSFHYKEDVWRASIVRKSGQFDARAAAGWADSSLWEETKRKGSAAISRLIDEGLEGTSVTAVLIGAHTAERDWVTYEIEKSIERRNGIFGVRVHRIEDQRGRMSSRGAIPEALASAKGRVYTWDPLRLGEWVELAAIDAGKKCLRHQDAGCWRCKFFLRYW